MTHFLFTLPYPTSRLNPNRANGRAWYTKQAAKQAARDEAVCAFLELTRGEEMSIGAPPFEAVITMYPPDKRRRDLDNLYSSVKCQQDILCSLLHIDDADIQRVTLVKGAVKRGGAVTVEIRTMETLDKREE